MDLKQEQKLAVLIRDNQPNYNDIPSQQLITLFKKIFVIQHNDRIDLLDMKLMLKSIIQETNSVRNTNINFNITPNPGYPQNQNSMQQRAQQQVPDMFTSANIGAVGQFGQKNSPPMSMQQGNMMQSQQPRTSPRQMQQQQTGNMFVSQQPQQPGNLGNSRSPNRSNDQQATGMNLGMNQTVSPMKNNFLNSNQQPNMYQGQNQLSPNNAKPQNMFQSSNVGGGIQNRLSPTNQQAQPPQNMYQSSNVGAFQVKSLQANNQIQNSQQNTNQFYQPEGNTDDMSLAEMRAKQNQFDMALGIKTTTKDAYNPIDDILNDRPVKLTPKQSFEDRNMTPPLGLGVQLADSGFITEDQMESVNVNNFLGVSSQQGSYKVTGNNLAGKKFASQLPNSNQGNNMKYASQLKQLEEQGNELNKRSRSSNIIRPSD